MESEAAQVSAAAAIVATEEILPPAVAIVSPAGPHAATSDENSKISKSLEKAAEKKAPSSGWTPGPKQIRRLERKHRRAERRQAGRAARGRGRQFVEAASGS